MTFAVILTVIRRRWRAVAAGALVGVLAGIALWAVTPTKYSATTSIVVSAGVSNPFTGTKEEVNIRTEQEILASREVARRASEALGVALAPGSFLLSQVDVAAPSGSQVLQVTVSASSADEAARAADALSEAYLEFRREGADTVVNGYLEKIDAQLAELQGRERDEATNSLIETLQQQRLSLVLTTSEPGRIIGEAEAPTSPSTPGLSVSLAGGLVGGAIAGIAAALLRERTDTRVRSRDRLARVSGAASLVAAAHGDAFWTALAERVAEVPVEDDDAPRVLLRVVGATDGAAQTVKLENAMHSTESALIAVERRLDPWEPEESDDSGEEDGADDLVADAEKHARVIDGTSDLTPRAFARLASRADVVVMLVAPTALLADVADERAHLEGIETPVVIGMEPARESDRAGEDSKS